MRAQKILLPVLVLFIITSCGNQSQNISSNNTDADSTSTGGVPGDSVKLVKTAEINCKVKDVEKSTRDLSEMTAKFGGMVFHQVVSSEENEKKELRISADSLMVISTTTPQSDVMVKVPAKNLNDFLFSVSSLGYFTENSTLDIQDKSLEYLENTLRQKNRKEVLADKPLKPTLSSNLKTIDIKDEMTSQQINNLTIDAEVSYSPVHLHFYQNPEVRKEVIANYNLDDYQLSFSKRFSAAMQEGWQYFVEFFLVLAHLWVFIVIVIVLYFIYQAKQQRKTMA
ncbi:MAG: DUF4349 domain-containing protein [Flavisolibacter sp.]